MLYIILNNKNACHVLDILLGTGNTVVYNIDSVPVFIKYVHCWRLFRTKQAVPSQCDKWHNEVQGLIAETFYTHWAGQD